MNKQQKIAGLFMSAIAIALIANQLINNFNFSI